MNRRSFVLFSLSCALSTSAVSAATSSRTGVIEEVQFEASNRAGYESLAYIRILGTWSGVTCNQTWAYFNSLDSPQLMAAALTARRSGQAIVLLVDDTYPKVDGICQIVNIRL